MTTSPSTASAKSAGSDPASGFLVATSSGPSSPTSSISSGGQTVTNDPLPQALTTTMMSTTASIKPRRIRQAVAQVMLINLFLPMLIYALFSRITSDVIALTISAVPPTIESVVTLVERRRIDAPATLVVFSIVLTIVASLGTQDARLLLLKDSITTVTLGLAFLLSPVVLKEDLIWEANKVLSDLDDAEAQAVLDIQYRNPDVRLTSFILCFVWGIGLLLEAAIRAILIYTLPINVMAYLSPLLLAIFLVILIAATSAVLRARRGAGVCMHSPSSPNPRESVSGGGEDSLRPGTAAQKQAAVNAEKAPPKVRSSAPIGP
ncbi:hypothetical protein HDU96_000972 [Phlyctochytrium bullatum]|nr:hypothetical protein HDU96_000972 [Phlyctochytrium bullatum]